MRKRSATAARGNRAREATVIIRVFINTHAITKQRTTALVRTRINRQDGDAATTRTRHIGEGCGE
jgi:hypothetical protein